MAKPKNTESSAPAFDVSQTDKRSDKRVVLDYVFAQRHAPELLDYFAPYKAELDEVLNTEGIQEIDTPVDTLIKQLSEKIVHRYENEYADYSLRGNGASFFTPKTGRKTKSPAEKAEQVIAQASPEQLEALAALMRERGIEL